MPLVVDRKIVEDIPSTTVDFLKTYPNFKHSCEHLCDQRVCEVGPKGLLYVGQREIGATISDDDDVQIIGSDDATTCHIGVLIHTGSGAVCVGHFDGCGTKKGFHSMVDLVMELSKDKPSGRLEMHLVGGFKDENRLSAQLSLEIIKVLMEHPKEIFLVTACITDYNTVYKEGIPFPIIYGLAVDIKQRKLFRATFPDKGPDIPLRGARNFTGGKEMISIYDADNRMMTIGPFTYRKISYLDMWLEASDEFIRQNLSTSPAQEPPHFVANVRLSLKQMLDHPNPIKTMFTNGKPRLYKMQSNGEWKRIDKI